MHIHRNFLMALVLVSGVASADTNFWTGTNNFSWSNAGGWSLGHAPAAGEDAAIATNRTIVLSGPTEQLASFVITKGSLLFTNWATTLNADYVEVGDGGKLTLSAAFLNNGVSNRIVVSCDNMLITTGGVILADGRGFAGGRAAVAGGPRDGNGPGASPYTHTDPSGGAGHGGVGGVSAINSAGGMAYDSAVTPLAPGSGAGGSQTCNGGAGGGAVRLTIADRLTVLGAITANGAAGTVASSRDGGGGSGGSIFISCDTIAGVGGAIRANGATTSTLAGGGGGGRIALHYDTAAQSLLPRPALQFSVSPGIGHTPTDRYTMADWGTLYFSDASGVFAVSNEITGFNGHLLFADNLGLFAADSLLVTNAFLGFNEATFQFQITNALTIATNAGLIGRGAVAVTCGDMTNSGLVKLGSNSAVTVSGNLAATNSEFALRWGSSLTVSGTWETAGATAIAYLQGVSAGVTGRIRFAEGAAIHVFGGPTNGTPGAWGARVLTPDDLILETGSWIYPFSDAANGGSPLFQCLNFLVDSSSGINADGRGFAQGKGPGGGVSGTTDPGGGGGHGGRGGNSSSGRVAGNPYGSATDPIHAGSGGGPASSGGAGGPGGGVIRLEVGNRILLNGTLSASGAPGVNSSTREGGGGAGGSILLLCNRFAGTGGVIRADGGLAYGSGTYGGSGAGGRIALRYDTAAQAALDKPTVRFSANAGRQFPNARQWLTGDWGTLCFPDVQHVFTLSEAMTNFSGYVVLPDGPAQFIADSLTISGSALGFETNGFSFQIAGPVTIATNGALISRSPQSLACSTFTSEGTVRFGTNLALTVTGDCILSNSFLMRTNSVLTVGQDLALVGANSLLSLDGVEAAIGRDLRVGAGVTFSVFAKPTNTLSLAWGARIATGRDIAIENGGWIHAYSELNNGGAPLFACRNMTVDSLAGINADGKGFTQNKGPGPGGSGNPSGGGGHGGRGGNSSVPFLGGAANGNALIPLNPGSGGGSVTSGSGGMGGGTIRVVATDALTLNGTFTANGASGPANSTGREPGGGAGGSIFVIASSFSCGPQAVLSAQGGAAVHYYTTNVPPLHLGAGGGGGGRIAVWPRASTGLVAQAMLKTNRLSIAESWPSYSGTASILGGTGLNSGTNGTLAFVVVSYQGSLILIK